MAILYYAYIPHIGAYLPNIDYKHVSEKSIDYGYISLIERIGAISTAKSIHPKTATIQDWSHILANLGFEVIRLNQKKVNSTVYSRAVIIDKDESTALIIFEKLSYD